MKNKKIRLAILLILYLFINACVYVVLPDDVAKEVAGEKKFWNAVATQVTKNEMGDLHIAITIQNNTGEWSTLKAAANKPAVLATNDGKSINCDKVFIGTGGHRFAPGFQMRGYSISNNDVQETQLLFVECSGAEAAVGLKLTIPYVSFEGELDDYEPEKNKSEGKLEINLDEVATDLTYPIAFPVEGLIHDASASFIALSENVVSLLDVQRSNVGFQFTWENFNPTKFALKTHIGTPPVIGEDGIIYGVYETLDIVSVPLTSANEKMDWTTEVEVPKDVKGLYILLSVESKKPRTYLNYVVDITTK